MFEKVVSILNLLLLALIAYKILYVKSSDKTMQNIKRYTKFFVEDEVVNLKKQITSDQVQVYTKINESKKIIDKIWEKLEKETNSSPIVTNASTPVLSSTNSIDNIASVISKVEKIIKKETMNL